MADFTREQLIQNLVAEITEQERKPTAQRNRGYVLDLVAEVADAVDGKERVE